MPMYHCKVVEFDKGTCRTKKVLSLVDTNARGGAVETFVQVPYRTILKVLGEIIAMRTHDTVKDALRFHRDIASDLHSRDKAIG